MNPHIPKTRITRFLSSSSPTTPVFKHAEHQFRTFRSLVDFFANGSHIRNRPYVSSFSEYPGYAGKINDFLDGRDFKSVDGFFKGESGPEVENLTRTVRLEYTSAGQLPAYYWEHADPKYFPKIEKQLESLFSEYLESNKRNDKQMTEDKIAKIRWWMSNAMFHARKSPGIIEQITRALEKEAGLKFKVWKRGIDPSVETFMVSECDYAEAYTSGKFFDN